MSTTQPRRPPGTPTGGQYAPSPHARPSFELGAEQSAAPRGAAWPEDPIAGRLTPAEVIDRLGFDRLDPAARCRYPPLGLVSITREVRHGVAGFRVHDMRSSASIRVGTKRTANRIAKLIDDDLHESVRRRP
ncbi:MAG: hypothetical protein M0Z42_06205 [Actinomycetota bacterium]|nr:hypothetical protein [Actinomycetota bacterium]